MPKRQPYEALDKWVIELQSKGRHSATLEEFRKQFPKKSEASLKLGINRLIKSGAIISIYKGYYLLIPPQYASRGILPAPLFIDGLMKFLKKEYYVGLLSAAAQYGAAHQQPQEFFVITSPPAIRMSLKKGIKINFINKKEINGQFIEKKKTDTGYFNISNPEMTAADLVHYATQVGGMNRVATVLNELADEMKPERLNSNFVNSIPAATLQKLGYLLDEVLQRNELADQLHKSAIEVKITFFRTYIGKQSKNKKYVFNPKWNIVNHLKIEIDE